MELEATTNPVEGEDTSADTLPETQEVETAEPTLDEYGNPVEPEPSDDDSEEVEHDGQKFRIPKAIKPLLLMQADYTRKTQEVAELRKTLEADRTNLHQSSEAELNAYANAQSIGQQLAAYAQVNWQGLMNQAAANYDTEEQARIQAEFMNYQQLKDRQQQAIGQLSHLRNQRLSAAQQETAKRIDEGRASLTKEIPGWNDDHKAKLIGFAAEYGFTADELSDLEADPRVAKVLHAAFEGRETSRKAAAAQRHLTAQTVQPAATVRAKSAPPVGLDDRLSIDEWTKRREAQLRKRTGR